MKMEDPSGHNKSGTAKFLKEGTGRAREEQRTREQPSWMAWPYTHLGAVSDSSRPHGLQPTRLLRAWDFPGKSTGVGCHRLLCCAEDQKWPLRRAENGREWPPWECCLQPGVTWMKALSGQTWLAAVASLVMCFHTSCRPRCSSPGPRGFQQELKARQEKPCSGAAMLRADSGPEPGLGSSLFCPRRWGQRLWGHCGWGEEEKGRVWSHLPHPSGGGGGDWGLQSWVLLLQGGGIFQRPPTPSHPVCICCVYVGGWDGVRYSQIQASKV